MKRRNFFVMAALFAPRWARAQEVAPAIRELARIVLPGGVDSGKVAASFVQWIRDYKAGAEIASGYGNPRTQVVGPNPSTNYAEQLSALGSPMTRTAVETALAQFDRIPQRPNGKHVAADLLAYFYGSPEGEDFLYGVAIKRDDCRGLANSTQRPPKVTE
jgi:hypothetical protein